MADSLSVSKWLTELVKDGTAGGAHYDDVVIMSRRDRDRRRNENREAVVASLFHSRT